MPGSTAEFRKKMSRTVVAVLLVVAVSGLVPLAANHGSCHSMPCCHKTKTAISASVGCCEPATCVKEQQALRAGATDSTHSVKFVPATFVNFVVPTPPVFHTAAPRSESPPSPTAQRLSVLSVLLI